MNKSLLVMICDFLLISILALVEFDVPEDEPTPQQQAEVAAAEGQEQDMVEVLRLSLEEEEARRQELSQNLEQREAELQEREQALAQTSEELQMTREEREQLAQQREQLEQERARLEQERSQLSSTVQETQSQLEQTRAQSEEELRKQRAQARQLQEELQRRQEELAQAKQQAEELARAREEAEKRASSLETNLQVAQTEGKILRENLEAAKTEVETARVQAEQAAQRAERLSSNVAQLAQTQQQSSEEIQRRIEEAQPITQNEIFRRFESNRVRLSFNFQRPQLLGGWSNESSSAPAVLVQDGNGQTFALVEASMTPFDPATLDGLRGARAQIRIGDRTLEIVEVGFLREDPRVVAVAIPDRYVQAAEKTPFKLSRDPLRFPDAVLVGQQQDRYGEVGFRVSSNAEEYISTNSQVLSRLFGNFAPVRGDFVFAKTGNLMGVMVSNGRGVVLQNLDSQAYLQLGQDFSIDRARELHSQLARDIPAE